MAGSSMTFVSFLRLGLSNGAVQLLSLVLTLFTSVFLARTLGVSGFGVYSYLMAIVAVVVAITELGYPTIILREVAELRVVGRALEIRAMFSRALRNLSFVHLSFAVIGCLSLYAFWDAVPSHYQAGTLLVLLIIPLWVSYRVINAVLFGMNDVVIAELMEKLLRPFLFALAIVCVFSFGAEFDSTLVLLCQIAAGFVALSLLLGVLRLRIPEQIRRAEVRHKRTNTGNAVFSLTVLTSLTIVNTQADALMLGILGTPVDVGIYKVASQGAFFVGLGLQVATSVVAPRLASHFASGESIEMERVAHQCALFTLLIAVPVVIVFVFFGETLIGLVFGTDYANAHIPLTILSIGFLVQLSFGAVGLILRMAKLESVSVRVILVSAVSNLCLNFALIPVWGIAGAAFATALCVVVSHGVLCGYVVRRMRINPTVFSRASLSIGVSN